MEQFFATLTADATINNTKSGKQVVNFGVAINKRYKVKATGERKQHTRFVDCSYWVNTGIAAYLKKGTRVALSGEMEAKAYLNREGKAVPQLTCRVNSIDLQGRARTSESPTAAPAAETDDLPF